MSELIVPGKWKCDQCGFALMKKVLAMNVGVVATDFSLEPNRCPNDHSAMRPYTWKEEASEAVEACERMFEEKEKLQYCLKAEREEVGELTTKYQAARDRLREACEALEDIAHAWEFNGTDAGSAKKVRDLCDRLLQREKI